MSPLSSFASPASLTASLNEFNVSWDLGILLFLLVASFIYAFAIGYKKVVFFLPSMYIALVIVDLMPYIENFTKEMPEFQTFMVRVGVFLILTAALSFFSEGSFLRLSFNPSKREGVSIWQQAILSFVTIGFLASSSLSFLPAMYYNKLSTITQEFFLFNNAHFWWALAGVVILVLVKRREKR